MERVARLLCLHDGLYNISFVLLEHLDRCGRETGSAQPPKLDDRGKDGPFAREQLACQREMESARDSCEVEDLIYLLHDNVD